MGASGVAGRSCFASPLRPQGGVVSPAPCRTMKRISRHNASDHGNNVAFALLLVMGIVIGMCIHARLVLGGKQAPETGSGACDPEPTRKVWAHMRLAQENAAVLEACVEYGGCKIANKARRTHAAFSKIDTSGQSGKLHRIVSSYHEYLDVHGDYQNLATSIREQAKKAAHTPPDPHGKPSYVDANDRHESKKVSGVRRVTLQN